MRVTVLGAQGMAGHVVSSYLEQQGHAVQRVGRNQLDIAHLNG